MNRKSIARKKLYNYKHSQMLRLLYHGSKIFFVGVLVIMSLSLYAADAYCVDADAMISSTNKYIGFARNIIWVGLLICSIILAIIKHKMICRYWRIIIGFFRIKGVESLDKKRRHISDDLMTAIKAKIPIAIIDNDANSFRGTRLLLESMGFKNIIDKYPIGINDVAMKTNLIFIIDIKGVSFGDGRNSSDKYEGLSVAEVIKRECPCARIIMYSSAIDDYRGNYILESVVDAKFEKDDGLPDKNQKIDFCVRQLFSPEEFWAWYSKTVLAGNHSSSEIAKIEKIFARELNRADQYNMQAILCAYKQLSHFDDNIKWMIDILSSIEWENDRI